MIELGCTIERGVGRIMPIYEFKCRACSHGFEALVRRGDSPDCPECGAEDLETLISLPAVSTQKTRDRSFAKARQRGESLRKEKAQAQAEYEHNYIKDHS
jgi:putative FmdB family regulatory protein